MKSFVRNIVVVGILLLINIVAFSQEIIKLKLSKQINLLDQINTKTVPLKTSDNFDGYSNYPQISNRWLGKLSFQNDQFWYNESRKNSIDAEFYKKKLIVNKVDTTHLSINEIKCYVGVFLGLTGSKRTIIVDANNNHDFSDDMLIEYDVSDISKYDDEYRKQFPIYKIEYEYFDNKTYKKEEYVKVYPAHKAYTYKNVEDENKAIYFTSFGFYSGIFNHDKQSYKVAISNLRSWPKHEMKGVDFSIKKKSQLHVYNDWFKYNQNTTIDDNRFEVLDYDFINDNLTIKVSKKTDNLGWQEGDKCPPIYAKTINKDSVNINNYFSQKDFTVIDFWGSWCKPCLEELPNLKRVYESLKMQRINMISIACEYETSKYKVAQKITNEKEIEWTQLYEKLNSDRGILETLRIDNYPTLILINKDGQILKRFYGKGAAGKLEEFLSK